MRLILKERVKSLGNVGDIVNVSAGFARNYLIPKHFAIVADESNKRFMEDQQRRLAKKMKEQHQAAMDLRKQINEAFVEITKRVGGNGKLFGAVTVSELVSELKKLHIEAEKRWFHLDAPIKELGSYEIRVKIFVDVEATLKLKVLMDPKQMEEMKRKAEEGLKAKERREKEALEAPQSEGADEALASDEAAAPQVEEVAQEEATEKKSKARGTKKAKKEE